MKRFSAHGPMIEDEKRGKYVRFEEMESELSRLRQRVAELEAENKERGDRMKSMREWIENDPEDNGGVSFVQRHSAHNWFDPETGEPL